MKKISLNFANTGFCDIVEKINNYIGTGGYGEMCADISRLNLVDASKVALLCSACHLLKYPDGKISWEVADEETRRTINNFKLKNMEIAVKENRESKKAAFAAV